MQGRLYSIPAHGGEPQRLGADFDGNWQDYTILSDGTLLAAGTKGTSTQVYRIKGEHAEKLSGIAGTYGGLNAASPETLSCFRTPPSASRRRSTSSRQPLILIRPNRSPASTRTISITRSPIGDPTPGNPSTAQASKAC